MLDIDTDLNKLCIDVEDFGDGEVLHEFIRMLAWMDICSHLGHNARWNVNYMGGWKSNLRFKVKGDNGEFDKVREDLKRRYFKRSTDQPKLFEF